MLKYCLMPMLLMFLFSDNLMAGPALTERNVYIGDEPLDGINAGLGGAIGILIALLLSAYIGLGIGEAVKNFLNSKRPYGAGNELLAVIATLISWAALPIALIIYWRQIILFATLAVIAFIVWVLKKDSHSDAGTTSKSQNSDYNKAPAENNKIFLDSQKDVIKTKYSSCGESTYTDNNIAADVAHKKTNNSKAKIVYVRSQIIEKNDRAIHGRTEYNPINDNKISKNKSSAIEGQASKVRPLRDNRIKAESYQVPNLESSNQSKVSHDQVQDTSNEGVGLGNFHDPTLKSDDAYEYKWWFDKSTGQILDTHSNKRYVKNQIRVFANGYLILDNIWVRESDVFIFE